MFGSNILFSGWQLHVASTVGRDSSEDVLPSLPGPASDLGPVLPLLLPLWSDCLTAGTVGLRGAEGER